MQTFALFIDDSRYSVATLQFLEADDLVGVRELARQELFASPHHLAVEVRDDTGAAFREERDPAAEQQDRRAVGAGSGGEGATLAAQLLRAQPDHA